MLYEVITYGPRSTISLLLLVAITGAIAFAVGTSVDVLILARVLMGIRNNFV